ncbi:TPA: hypothetical protein DCE37_14415 [Candidatus Latescibacteria bacterium]|nr:hypothetical protein [Candidatus Latescibacterota bacterium]
MLSLIACMAKNRVIGRDNDIPWNVPGEQAIFRRVTSGHAVIMGRKTYESIGRPLPKRTNIVVTRQSDYEAPGCTIVTDLSSALEAVPADEDEAFIMGGGQLYSEALGQADRIYLSELSEDIDGEITFPDFEDDFNVVSEDAYPDATIPYVHRVYERT